MDGFEPKKLALIRIYQILKEYSDRDHPVTQDDLSRHLEKDYGIKLERKAIGRNISLLKEAGVEIESNRSGNYLACREFEDSELRLLIDGVLCSKHITASYSADLINRLCGLSNKYFRSHIKNIYSVNEWNKTSNQELFFNIEMVDSAIEQNICISYDYNKFGIDKKLHKSSYNVVSPYQLILHNQRYYLMAYNEYWKHIVFHRLDRITNINLTEEKATEIRSVKGYENGIDYKKISSSLPYMFSDEIVKIDFIAEVIIIDQVIDWFGNDITIEKIKSDETKVKVSVISSPNAMVHWAMQYINFVEVISPESVRKRIKESIEIGNKKYI